MHNKIESYIILYKHMTINMYMEICRNALKHVQMKSWWWYDYVKIADGLQKNYEKLYVSYIIYILLHTKANPYLPMSIRFPAPVDCIGI